MKIKYKKQLLGLLFALTMYFPIHMKTQYDSYISMFFVFLLALPLIYGVFKYGDLKLKITFFILSFFALFIETIGVMTGFPYSSFYYLDSLGIKVFSTTPIVLLLTFSPLVFGAIYYATKITNNKYKIFLSAVLFLVIFDLILDPVAVALNYWVWDNPGTYYSIPFLNYLGWIFTASIVVGIYYYLNKFKTTKYQELSFYYSIWIWTGAAFYLTLHIPFLIGIIMLIYIEKYLNE